MKNETCKSCVIAQGNESIPYIYKDDLWTINLRLGPPPPRLLLGWAVLQPRRHVSALADLSSDEQRTIGPLLARCERAMQDIMGIKRIYVCLFAEASDFHLHLHLIPRRPDLPSDFIGPAVFNMNHSSGEPVTPDEVEDLCGRLKAALVLV